MHYNAAKSKKKDVVDIFTVQDKLRHVFKLSI